MIQQLLLFKVVNSSTLKLATMYNTTAFIDLLNNNANYFIGLKLIN